MAASIWNPGSNTTQNTPAVEPFQFVPGTALVPGISFVGDPDTGIWSQSEGYINFSINGVNKVTIDPDGNLIANSFASGPELEVASAATIDLGGVVSNSIRITGSSSITSFGTNYKGPKFVRFESSLTLSHSNILICPGGVNLTVGVGDACIITPKATAGVSDGWYVMSLSSGGGSVTGSGATGGGTDKIFQENDTLVTSSYTIGDSTMKSGVAITIASPAVCTLSGHGFVAGQPVRFATLGTLPTGLATNTVYYVIAAGLTSSQFQVSTTLGGAAVNTSGSQSNTQSVGKIRNAEAVGALSVVAGATLTIPSGSRLVVL